MCFCRSAVSVKTFFWLFSPRLLGAYKHAAPALLRNVVPGFLHAVKKWRYTSDQTYGNVTSYRLRYRGSRREGLKEVNRHWTKGTAQSGREANALRGIEKERAKRNQAEQARQNQSQTEKTNGEKTQKLELIPPSIDPCAVKGTDQRGYL